MAKLFWNGEIDTTIYETTIAKQVGPNAKHSALEDFHEEVSDTILSAFQGLYVSGFASNASKILTLHRDEIKAKRKEIGSRDDSWDAIHASFRELRQVFSRMKVVSNLVEPSFQKFLDEYGGCDLIEMDHRTLDLSRLQKEQPRPAYVVDPSTQRLFYFSGFKLEEFAVPSQVFMSIHAMLSSAKKKTLAAAELDTIEGLTGRTVHQLCSIVPGTPSSYVAFLAGRLSKYSIGKDYPDGIALLSMPGLCVLYKDLQSTHAYLTVAIEWGKKLESAESAFLKDLQRKLDWVNEQLQSCQRAAMSFAAQKEEEKEKESSVDPQETAIKKMHEEIIQREVREKQCTSEEAIKNLQKDAADKIQKNAIEKMRALAREHKQNEIAAEKAMLGDILAQIISLIQSAVAPAIDTKERLGVSRDQAMLALEMLAKASRAAPGIQQDSIRQAMVVARFPEESMLKIMKSAVERALKAKGISESEIMQLMPDFTLEYRPDALTISAVGKRQELEQMFVRPSHVELDMHVAVEVRGHDLSPSDQAQNRAEYIDIHKGRTAEGVLRELVYKRVMDDLQFVKIKSFSDLQSRYKEKPRRVSLEEAIKCWAIYQLKEIAIIKEKGDDGALLKLGRFVEVQLALRSVNETFDKFLDGHSGLISSEEKRAIMDALLSVLKKQGIGFAESFQRRFGAEVIASELPNVNPFRLDMREAIKILKETSSGDFIDFYCSEAFIVQAINFVRMAYERDKNLVEFESFLEVAEHLCALNPKLEPLLAEHLKLLITELSYKFKDAPEKLRKHLASYLKAQETKEKKEEVGATFVLLVDDVESDEKAQETSNEAKVIELIKLIANAKKGFLGRSEELAGDLFGPICDLFAALKDMHKPQPPNFKKWFEANISKLHLDAAQLQQLKHRLKRNFETFFKRIGSIPPIGNTNEFRLSKLLSTGGQGKPSQPELVGCFSDFLLDHVVDTLWKGEQTEFEDRDPALMQQAAVEIMCLIGQSVPREQAAKMQKYLPELIVHLEQAGKDKVLIFDLICQISPLSDSLSSDLSPPHKIALLIAALQDSRVSFDADVEKAHQENKLTIEEAIKSFVDLYEHATAQQAELLKRLESKLILAAVIRLKPDQTDADRLIGWINAYAGKTDKSSQEFIKALRDAVLRNPVFLELLIKRFISAPTAQIAEFFAGFEGSKDAFDKVYLPKGERMRLGIDGDQDQVRRLSLLAVHKKLAESLLDSDPLGHSRIIRSRLMRTDWSPQEKTYNIITTILLLLNTYKAELSDRHSPANSLGEAIFEELKNLYMKGQLEQSIWRNLETRDPLLHECLARLEVALAPGEEPRYLGFLYNTENMKNMHSAVFRGLLTSDPEVLPKYNVAKCSKWLEENAGKIKDDSKEEEGLLEFLVKPGYAAPGIFDRFFTVRCVDKYFVPRVLLHTAAKEEQTKSQTQRQKQFLEYLVTQSKDTDSSRRARVLAALARFWVKNWTDKSYSKKERDDNGEAISSALKQCCDNMGISYWATRVRFHLVLVSAPEGEIYRWTGLTAIAKKIFSSNPEKGEFTNANELDKALTAPERREGGGKAANLVRSAGKALGEIEYALSPVTDAIVEVAAPVVKAIGEAAAPVTKAVKKAAGKAGKVVTAVATPAMNAVGTTAAAVGRVVTPIMQPIGKAVASAVEMVAEDVQPDKRYLRILGDEHKLESLSRQISQKSTRPELAFSGSEMQAASQAASPVSAVRTVDAHRPSLPIDRRGAAQTVAPSRAQSAQQLTPSSSATATSVPRSKSQEALIPIAAADRSSPKASSAISAREHEPRKVPFSGLDGGKRIPEQLHSERADTALPKDHRDWPRKVKLSAVRSEHTALTSDGSPALSGGSPAKGASKKK